MEFRVLVLAYANFEQGEWHSDYKAGLRWKASIQYLEVLKYDKRIILQKSTVLFMTTYTRAQISEHIIQVLEDQKPMLLQQFKNTSGAIGYFFVDNVLPEDLAMHIENNFPSPEEMRLKKSLKEFKRVGAQMDTYAEILEETIYAFQHPKIVQFISEICGYVNVTPDEHLYAGGLSLMEKGNFLNPHLDNSHDKDRNLWRVLNLLYYVNPDWTLENGGNLELWPNGIKEEPITIVSKFNRLVVMATHEGSWHSVSKVTSAQARRCISNYYFSDTPIRATDTFHVTTFRARPGEFLKNSVLQLDSTLRMGIRKIFKKGIVENPHVYKKDKDHQK